MKINKHWYYIAGFFGLISAIFYAYLYFSTPLGFTPLYRNWDGPNYIVIAKSFYDADLIAKYDVMGLHKYFFAAHFPLYPVFIRLFSFVGYFQSSVLVSLGFTLLAAIAFYELSVLLKLKNPLILSLVFLVFTPRWFVVSHTGSSEPLFLFFMLMFIINFIKGKPIKSALWGVLAQYTRAQGILLFVGIGIYYLWQLWMGKIKFKQAFVSMLPYLAIPLALLSVFTLYYFQFGNFLAFFEALKGYGHLGIPYRIFRDFRETAIIFPLEVMVFNYLIYGIAIFKLITEKEILFSSLALPFLVTLPLLSHLDVSRYAIPLLPFVLISFSEIFSKKYVQLALLLVIPAIMAYASSIIFFNQSL